MRDPHAAAVAAITAGGLVLFLGIGMRQGFGLFYLPVAPDLDITRETSFQSDLELESIEFVKLSELLQQQYGARVDFVDIDPRTYNLCPKVLEEKLGKAASKNAGR